MRMLITHVHTLITPSPTSILWSSQSVWFILLLLFLFFLFRKDRTRGSTTESPLDHLWPIHFLCLILCPHLRFSHSSEGCSCIFLSDVASGAAIQDCETCVKRLPLLIDGSNQNKHRFSKFPPCCVETTKLWFLIFTMAAFLFSRLRCLVIYPIFIWALCVFGMYTENPSLPPTANIGAQGKKGKKKKPAARGLGKERQRMITLGGTEDLSSWLLHWGKHRGFCRRWSQGPFVLNWPRWSQLSRMSPHQSIPLMASCVFCLYIQHIGVFQGCGWGTGLSYNILHWDLCNFVGFNQLGSCVLSIYICRAQWI